MKTTVLFAKDPSAMLDPVNHARKALLSASVKDYFDVIVTLGEDYDKDTIFERLQCPQGKVCPCRSMSVGDVIKQEFLLGVSNGTLEKKSFFWVCNHMGWTVI